MNNVKNHSNISPSHLEGTPWLARLFQDFFTTRKFHFKWLMCASGPLKKKKSGPLLQLIPLHVPVHFS